MNEIININHAPHQNDKKVLHYIPFEPSKKKEEKNKYLKNLSLIVLGIIFYRLSEILLYLFLR